MPPSRGGSADKVPWGQEAQTGGEHGGGHSREHTDTRSGKMTACRRARAVELWRSSTRWRMNSGSSNDIITSFITAALHKY